jgi:hypothetical protein
VANARGAYLAGFDATSNLEAGRRYGVPTSGTVAHAFVLAHDTERAAFEAYCAASRTPPVLLVDTYDTLEGVRTAVDVAGPGLGAVRLDSGDLPVLVPQVRALLDELGARQTQIVCTGDLDEDSIPALAALGVDVFGVGSRLAGRGGAPSAGLVYKVVEQDGRGVAKRSTGKSDVPGAKAAYRALDDDGRAVAEVLRPVGAPAPDGPHRALQSVVVRSGEVVAEPDLAAARATTPPSRPSCRTRPWPPATRSRPACPEEPRADRYDSRTALLVVDVQNDFADPQGGLYVTGGEQVVPVASREAAAAARAGAVVVTTQDWHPAQTPHFVTGGGVWPVHCVADTWGAELHPDLQAPGEQVRKGTAARTATPASPCATRRRGRRRRPPWSGCCASGRWRRWSSSASPPTCASRRRCWTRCGWASRRRC